MAAAAAAALLAGCNESENAAPRSDPLATDRDSLQQPERRRGRQSTNVQEAAGLVRDHVRERPVRCRTEREQPGMAGLYRCTAGGRELRVEWEHYGTGRYTITELPGGGVIARGTLSISE